MEGKIKSLYIKSLQNCLLNQIRSQISKPSFTTWFENFSIVDLVHKKSIVFATDTLLKKEWIENRYKSLVLDALIKIEDADYDTVTFFVIEDSGKSDNSPQIESSAFGCLFEGVNNEFDEEYKDYIDSDELAQQSKLLREKIRENHIYTNELFEKINRGKIERLVTLEENILQIHSKQLEQDNIIDHMTILTTRLEAKVASLEKRIVYPSHSQDVE
jgi:chromosomal replication initiation ATPase DnaA